MQVSLQMHSSEGSLEGMSGMDKGEEPSSPNSKQGLGKSHKQDKPDGFARLFEGLVKHTGTGAGGPGLGAPGKAQGRGSEESPADEALQGKSSKKQQHKKLSLSAGAAQEQGKSGSGKELVNVRQGGKDKTDGEGAFAFLALQEGPAPKQGGSKEGLLQKDRLRSLRPEEAKIRRSPGASSRTANAAGQAPGQNEGASQEAALKGSLSKVKADDVQGSGGDERGAFRKPSSLKVRQSAEAAEQLGLSPASRQSLGAAEEPERKGLKGDADTKTRDKRRDRLDLRDLRSREGVESASGVFASGDGKGGGESKTLELFVNLRSDTQEREAVPASGDRTFNRTFEDLLSRELSQNLSTDIVRQAQVLLRDSGEGTIRLALRPESLGNVKIQLELAEKKIIGHIIVESNEALRAFEREIHSLEQAFKDSGFGETSLDTALASEGDEKGGDPQQREGGQGPFFSERLAASTYDTGMERHGELEMRMIFTGSGVSSEHIPINMLV